jgi:hypothetical protein
MGLGRLTQSYQLVEGRVLSVGEGAGRVYLNFARDWKSDFTVAVARKDVSAFTRGRRSQSTCRQKVPRARLGYLAKRPHDRGHSSRADRSAGG